MSIEAVFDNGGRTFDRYTVYFEGEEGGALVVGPTGNSPRGVCMWIDRACIEEENPKEEITFSDLPEPAQRAALAMNAELRHA